MAQWTPLFIKKNAGIYTDQPESWKAHKAEKRLGKIHRLSDTKVARDPVTQIQLKGRCMGFELLQQLLKAGQILAVLKILPALNWLDLALMLVWMGEEDYGLPALAARLSEVIFVDNTLERHSDLGEPRFFLRSHFFLPRVAQEGLIFFFNF